MNVIFNTTWTCSAMGCGNTHKQAHVLSVFAAMDPRTEMRRPCPPGNWQIIEGLAYCHRHSVEATAVIRTPVFAGADVEEVVRLRNAA